MRRRFKSHQFINFYPIISLINEWGRSFEPSWIPVNKELNVSSFQNVVHSIYFNIFASKLQNLLQWMPLECRCSLSIFLLQYERPRWNCRSKWCLLNIFWPFAWSLSNLLYWVTFEIFESHGQGQTFSIVSLKFYEPSVW